MARDSETQIDVHENYTFSIQSSKYSTTQRQIAVTAYLKFLKLLQFDFTRIVVVAGHSTRGVSKRLLLLLVKANESNCSLTSGGVTAVCQGDTLGRSHPRTQVLFRCQSPKCASAMTAMLGRYVYICDDMNVSLLQSTSHLNVHTKHT